MSPFSKTRRGDGELTAELLDPFILGLEIVNFALLIYLLRSWLTTANKLVNQILQKIGLRVGAGESILEKVKRLASHGLAPQTSFSTGVQPSPPGSPTSEQGQQIDVGQLQALAKQYLPGLQKGSTEAELVGKFLQGKLTEKDLTKAIPLFLGFLRQSNQAPPGVPPQFTRW